MPLCFLRAKPIGVMQMIDQGEQVANHSEAFSARLLLCWALSHTLIAEYGKKLDLLCEMPGNSGTLACRDCVAQDDKIIAVHHDDPEFRHYEDISQLPKHRLMEIRRRAPPTGHFHVLAV